MKYWAYVNNEILGPYEIDEVKALPAYSPTLLVCPQTPVGAKTEEWREVSSCPEFADGAVIDSPVISEQIPDQIETSTLQIDHNFSMSNSGRLKSSRIGQIAPLESINPSASGVDIPINKLESSGRMKVSDISWNLAEAGQQETIQQNTVQEQAPEPQPAAQQPGNDAFSSLYNLDTPAQETPAAEPAAAQAPVPGLEPIAGMTNAAPQPAAQPIEAMPMQNTQEFTLGEPKTPAPAAMPAAMPTAMPASNPEIDSKIMDLQTEMEDKVSKEDLTMAVDPIKMKLDQFDDMFTSIRNNQQQTENSLMSKLNSLENTLSSLSNNMMSQQNNYMPEPQSMGSFESVSLTPADSMKGYDSSASLTPADPAESLKKESKKKKKEEITDSGSKAASTNIFVRFFKWIFKMIITLILLIALILGSAVGLKKYEVFNVSPYIVQAISQYAPQYKDTIVPFLLEESDWKAGGTGNAAETSNAEQPAEEVPADEAKPLLTPEQEAEILSAIKGYKKDENGQTLEEKLKDTPGYKDEGWSVKPGSEEGKHDAVLSILEPEAKSFEFIYSETDKSLTGKNPESQAVIDSLAAQAPAKKRRGRKGKKAAAEAAEAKQAAAAAAAKPASQKDGEFIVDMDEE